MYERLTVFTRRPKGMMSSTLVTWLIWSLAVLYVENAEADTRLPCPSVQRDFYPGVAPQDSSPPYVLNVTDKDGQHLYDLRYYSGDAIYQSKIWSVGT